MNDADPAPAAYIDLRSADDGQLYYVTCAANHAVLTTSETYPTHDHLARAVEDFQRAFSIRPVIRDSTVEGPAPE